MKYTYFYVLMLAVLIIIPGVVFAQEASPSAAPDDAKTKQIEELKERLATKVAELRQTQRIAIAGTVKSMSISTFAVETKTKDVKIELTDEIYVYQFIKGIRTKLTAENIEKGDNVVVYGEYDTTLDILKAKVVFIQSVQPVRVYGIVADSDKTEFTLTINNPQGQSYILDIEKITKTFSWNTRAIEKSGFSKIAVGDMVFVLGTPVPKAENRLSALRILDIPDGKNPILSATDSAGLEQATPSSSQ